MKKKIVASNVSNPLQKKLHPQQAEVLKTLSQAFNANSPQQKNEAWQLLKTWVQKRLYPWLTQYAPIADELVQEGLITLWLTLKNNPPQPEQTPTAHLAYYWHLVAILEQKARSISQKEIRHWNKQVHFNTPTTDTLGQAWEEQVYFHSHQLQSDQAFKVLEVELGDIARCMAHLFNQLKKRAILGEKALWFLKKRFNLEVTSSQCTTSEDPSHQKTIAQTLGISQQAVSSYEKRLLKQCQQWLMPYYPF